MNRPRYVAILACVLALQVAACSRQTAEEKGKEPATEKIDMAKGIGDVLQEKGTAAAESVTSGMGKVLHGLEVYLLSSQDVSGTLKIKVRNALDQEIGRTKLPLKQASDEARYVRIPLDAQVDLGAISKVDIDFLPTPGTP